MPREDVDLGLGTHVPDARRGVATRGDEDIEGRVQGERVHAREMSVVVPDDLVHLEVPALDHLRGGERTRRGGGAHTLSSPQEKR